MLKGQDVAFIIKLLIKQNVNKKIEFKSIAYELYISQSEISKGILRLEKAQLINRIPDSHIEIQRENLQEFFIHALKYLFPSEINIATRGVATAYSPPLIKQFMMKEQPYVWPYIDGKNKGLSLTPIYKTLPHAIDRYPDEHFYKIMSALDLIRLGGSRENAVAKEILDYYLWHQRQGSETIAI